MVNWKVLFEFCENNNSEKLKTVLETLDEVNAKDPKTGWTLLSVSAYNHSFECVKLLLDHNANINTVSNNGTSVLMYAKTKVLENRNFDYLDFLIENGADIFLKDKFGKDILDYVKEKEDKEMIEYFTFKMRENSK